MAVPTFNELLSSDNNTFDSQINALKSSLREQENKKFKRENDKRKLPVRDENVSEIEAIGIEDIDKKILEIKNKILELKDEKKREIKKAFLREHNEEFQKILKYKWNNIRSHEYSPIYILFTPVSILLLSGGLIFLSALFFHLSGSLAVTASVKAIQFPVISSPFFNMLFLGLAVFLNCGSIAFAGCVSFIGALTNLYHLYDFGNRVSNGQSLRPDYFNTNSFYETFTLINYPLASILEFVLQVIHYCADYVISNIYNLYQNTKFDDKYVDELVSSSQILKNKLVVRKSYTDLIDNRERSDDSLKYDLTLGRASYVVDNAPKIIFTDYQNKFLKQVLSSVNIFRDISVKLFLSLNVVVKNRNVLIDNNFPSDVISVILEFFDLPPVDKNCKQIAKP